jgi:hypothetical protein
MLEMTETPRVPNLLPAVVVLGLILWMFTTTGGQQILVNEILSQAYDSQAEHFLRGNVDIDADAIRHEAMIVNGRARTYFGPFPAFLRIPLDRMYPSGRGRWSRITGFCAGMIALGAFAGLTRMSLRSSALSNAWKAVLGNACLVGFAFGSPLLLLLGNLSIYDEAVIWAFALSLAALFFAFRAQEALFCSGSRVGCPPERLEAAGKTLQDHRLATALLGFSFCASGALLSRVTFGAPLILIAPMLALSIWPQKQISNFAALFLPLGAALAFYLWLGYARFGSLLGVNYNYYINPRDRAFIHNFGVFSLRRIPYSFADYFTLHLPSFYREPPFLLADRHRYDYSSLFMNPLSEVYVSLLWCSSWLIFGAIIGILYLVRTRGTGFFERGVAIALFAQCLLILSFYGLAQRYAAELYPFLIFAFVLFLRSGGATFLLRYALIGLIVISVVINSLATASWLVDADINVPPTTRGKWEQLLGRKSLLQLPE